MKFPDLSLLPDAGDNQASRRRLIFCAEQGLLKHALPKQFGGYENSFELLVENHETLGNACLDTGLMLSINAHLWGAVFPMLHYGTQEQQQCWLEKLISGALIGGHAISEPQAGSDINALQTTAKATSDGFILNGCKRYITNTPIADLIVIYAQLDNQLSAFIVKNDDPGAKFTDSPTVNGCTTATMGDIILENCRIASDRQLGKTGMGTMMIQHALELERGFIFAGISGIMKWQLEQVINYSRERKVNDQHLGKNQAVSHKIADMKLRLDTTRLWVRECARLKDRNKRITMASAQTKLYASEAFLQSSLDAVQIQRASGLMASNKLTGLVNDAMASRLFSGSSEIQKNIIAALSGTGDGYRYRKT